jgi:hypothetical protein
MKGEKEREGEWDIAKLETHIQSITLYIIDKLITDILTEILCSLLSNDKTKQNNHKTFKVIV